MHMRIDDARKYSPAGLSPNADSHIEWGMDLAAKIRNLREGLGLDQKGFAKVVGASQSSVSRWESPRFRQKPAYDHLLVMASMSGQTIDEFLERNVGALDANTNVRVVGQVQAGAWQEAVEWEHDQQYSLNIPEDSRYKGLPRFGLEVRGSSMNQVYPEGTIVICVKLLDLGADPDIEQRVIFIRKDEHGLIEATVKELDIDDDGQVWLVPRSDSPGHREAIRLQPPDDGDDQQIWALVIGSIQPELVPNRSPAKAKKRPAKTG